MCKLIVLFATCLFCGTVAATPALTAYGHLPNIELAKLSPSGERYAFIATAGNARHLGIFSNDGKLLMSIPVGDTKVSGLVWAGEEHVLVTLSSTYERQVNFTQAFELYPVVNVDLKTRKTSAIFANHRNINGAVWGYYGSAEFEGHRCGFFGGITLSKTLRTGEYYFDNGYPDLYRVDLDTGKTTLVEDGDRQIHDWVIGPDGQVAAHSEYEEKTGVWSLYRGKGHDRQLLQKNSPLNRLSLLGFGRTADTVLILDNDHDDDTVSEIALGTGATQTLLEGQAADGFLSDPDTGALLGTTTPDEPGAQFFESALQSRYQAARKAFPDLQMELASYSRKLGHVIVVSDGGDDSGTWWIIDMSNGKASMIGSAYPEITPDDVGPTRWFKYTAADGLAIEAVLTLPPGRKPEHLPLVMLPHGGPLGVHDHLGFDWWAQAYASAGYAVLQPNFRASSGSSRALREAGFGQWGRKMQTDLSDGLQALASSGIVDPKRVCIVGASYGGYAALAGVTVQQGLYRCAVSVAGVADLPDFFEWQQDRYGDRSSATRFWRRLIGAEQNGDQVMRSLSPTRLAERADAPILLIHGKDDTVVPIEQSRAMESALKSAHKSVAFLMLDGEDHWLSRPATRTTMLKAAVEFVQRYNPAE